MSSLKNKQPNDIRAWSSVISNENPSNFLYPDQDVPSNEQVEEPREARAWSTCQSTHVENVLDEGPTRHQKLNLATRVPTQYQKSKEDIHTIEHVLSYVDRHRRPRQKKYRLTWRTFIGTMSGMDKIYARDSFLQHYPEFRPLWIFTDSVFRGIAQVMFANNPLSGIIITIGLFIGNWELALYGLLGTSVSTLTAHILGFNYDSIRAGLFGYNGCLTAMGIAYFSFSGSPQMIGPVVIMSMFSSVFAMAISKILVQRLGLSPFTFSFQICSWIWLLGSLKYHYFFVDGTILSPNLLITLQHKPDLANVSFPGYSVTDNFVGFFNSISQVYFIDNPYTGAIILVGVCLCSRILSFFALFGAVTAQLTAAYLLGVSPASIHAGLWGFNSVLTCQALGGMFFVLHGYRIWIFTLYGSIMTVLLQGAVASFLTSAGMPTFTFPFTIICWIFCLIAGSKNLIAVKLTAVSIPEDHSRRFRLSRLVKAQFKYISHLTHFSSAYDEDITWEELSKINEIFVPLLMCSYADKGDMNSLKMLIKQEVNIHSTDQNLRTPLHISASQGNTKLTNWLVRDLKLNVNTADKFGNTPLFEALWNGHFHLLQLLYLQGGRLPGSKPNELAFYLNAFVYEENLEAIQCFLSCGFNPNTPDYDGRNALHLAVMTNQYDIVCYLVEETQVFLELEDNSSQTAINYALGLSNLTIANYLLNKKENNHMPRKLSEKNATLLRVVIDKTLENKKNIDPNNEDKKSLINIDENLLPTLFCMTAAGKDNTTMENFLKEFPHINILECVDYDLRTIAHIAATKGHFEIIKFLFEQCHISDFERIINREDRWGLSPLDEAYRNGHNDICKFIQENISTQNNQFVRKISNLTESEFEDNATVRLLHKWKKIFLFCTLAASGAAERINALLARGYFIRTERYADYHDRTPMHFAATNGHLNVVQQLVRYGYDGLTCKDRWGMCPIDDARNNGFNNIVDKLCSSNL